VDSATIYDLIGYVASALIVLSLLMSSLLRLRVINLVGAIVFSVYGVLIDSIPVIVTNGAIVLIDIYYLWVMLRDRAADVYFEVVEVPVSSPLLERFVAFHDAAIREFQPAFAGLRDDHLAWMILRDASPVGVVLGRLEDGPQRTSGGASAGTSGVASAEAGAAGTSAGAVTGTGAGTGAAAGATLRLDVDHVTAPHRDFRPGAALFGSSGAFRSRGIGRVVSAPGNPAHQHYLERMGFVREGEDLTRSVR
jgi:hypothetical protein